MFMRTRLSNRSVFSPTSMLSANSGSMGLSCSGVAERKRQAGGEGAGLVVEGAGLHATRVCGPAEGVVGEQVADGRPEARFGPGLLLAGNIDGEAVEVRRIKGLVQGSEQAPRWPYPCRPRY